MALILDPTAWATAQFGDCDLGDARRTKRLIKFATQAASAPDAATPDQTETWGDCKAAYRLMNSPDVTFDAVAEPHRAQTRLAAGTSEWLIINDTTEINFGHDRELEGVGRVGGARGRGFHLHTALMVSLDGSRVVGVAGQDLHARPLTKVKRVSSAERKRREDVETGMWGRVIDQVGKPPEGASFIHVCDRGADNFEIYCHLREQSADWVIRAAQLNRMVLTDDNHRVSLDHAISAAPPLGGYVLQVPENGDQAARTARLEVRLTKITMPRPMTGVSQYVRKLGLESISMYVVEAREVNPPPDTTPLRWVLLTSREARGFDDALKILDIYKKRPIIEEYHKCLKTGCRVEQRQYRTGAGLKPVIALLSVLAVRLLQLKTEARDNPDRPAREVVPSAWLDGLAGLRKPGTRLETVRDFFRQLAGLGGFLGRKSDGEPGWLTTWRGLDKLLLALRGAEKIRLRSG